MRTIDIVIFLTIVLLIYGSSNYYIFIRGWQAIPKEGLLRSIYLSLFLFLSLSYVIGRIFERVNVCAFSDAFIWIGSFWLGFMLYFFLAVVSLDILRLLNHFFGIFPRFVTENYGTAKLITALVIAVITGAVIGGGYLNSISPRIKRLDLGVNKKAGNLDELNIALATDIHLGTIISNSRLTKLAGMIETIDPDVILLAGDIVDEDLKPVIEKNLGEIIKKFKSRYGTFAVTGNHEYIGGVEAANRYLRDHNITVIRDEAVLIDNAFYLAGREDLTYNRYTGKKRKTLEKILSKADDGLPVILMDHQPYGLSEAVENRVDLQVSGHTHDGQLWPGNYVVRMIFELASGYRRIENTHFYVSTGYGTWGPPVRVGQKPEVVHIRITFK